MNTFTSNKAIWLTSLLLAMLIALTGQALGFKDIDNTPGKEHILELKEQGIISGVDTHTFQPQGNLTYAQGIHLIVKALGLNIDHIRFIKEPKASDSYPHVQDDAWYAHSFIVASLTGLDVPKDVEPSKPMTREQFGYHLMRGVDATGSYAYPKIFIQIRDHDSLTSSYMDHIQRLLIIRAAQLDNDGRFYPKKVITRAEAAVMLNTAKRFTSQSTVVPQPQHDDSVTFKTVPVTKEVNKIILSWGEKPHAGYRISIDGITFDGDTAIIQYTLHHPSPDAMYAQVITEPTAATYLASEYKVKLEPSSPSSVSSHAAVKNAS